jgi:hypothetical protein
MSFWSTQLGGAPAPVAPAAPSAYPGGWSPSPYFQRPAVQAPTSPQVAPQQPEQQQGWGTIQGSIKKARSASLTDTCPECNSGDYFRPVGNPNAMIQCYSCGYNPRFAHMTAGGGLPSDASSPAQPARQIEGGGLGGRSQYQPQNIAAGRLN